MTRIIIRAVPDRQSDVDYLLKHIPDAEVCWETFDYEDKNDNVWNTFLKAMKMAGDDPVVHMEEDVILTQNFRDKLESAIAEHPDQIKTFFSMRDKDLTVGSREDRYFLMAQCWYAPAYFSRYIHSFYPYWEYRRQAHPNSVDLMIQHYIHAMNIRYRIHVPNLVQHRQRASYIDGNRSENRLSCSFKDPV